MIGVIALTIIAFVLSIIITFISSLYEIEEIDYQKHLPGFDCGVCGFHTCKGMAHSMVEDPTNYKKCRPLRGEKLTQMEEYLKENKLID